MITEVSPEAARRKTAARSALRRWKVAHDRRDEVIREAHAAGLSTRDIHRETQVALTTIVRVLKG